MTYDQAQSPRLGQRTAVESTYVRSFDADVTTPDADLLEAAWPGMLIFRSDLSILQIYDGELGAWLDVAGGVAGAATYVGASAPTGGVYTIGDIWYDSDDGYRAYVWDGTQWTATKAGGGVLTFRQPDPPTSVNIGDIWIDSNDGEKMYRASVVGANSVGDPGWVLVQDHGIPHAQATADIKTRAYYIALTSDFTDPLNPIITFPTLAPDGADLTVGDVIYQTNWRNHPWFFAGPITGPNNGWVDAVDPNIASSTDLANLKIQVQNNTLTGTSANNTADTAEGQISTSDYTPGTDDLIFIKRGLRLDTTDPNNPVEVPYDYPVNRAEGSIWFTQTRPRVNWCTNPSVETNLNFWTSSGATMARVNAFNEPAGLWTMEITNTGTSDHTVTWGATAPASASEGQSWTASLFAQMMTGNGTGLTMELRWVDVNGTYLSSSTSDPFNIIVNAWDPALKGTIQEPRFLITGTAPASTAGVYLRLTSPAGANNADVWHMGGVLLEPRADLGRYFDGDSGPELGGDGHWLGTPQNSRSELTGDRIFEVWELREGGWVRKFLTDATQTVVDGGQLTGVIDGGLIADNTLVQDKQYAALVKAYEALGYGDLVNLYSDNGLFTARKADAANGYEAHGFVWDTTAAGQSVRVYHTGYIDRLANLTPGTQWLSTTPGKMTNIAPVSTNRLVQQVGFAPSATIFNFEPHEAIKVI